MKVEITKFDIKRRFSMEIEFLWEVVNQTGNKFVS